MLKEFNSYIVQQSLFQKQDHILLAVSGGIDSVVLAHLFHASKLHFSMAHCNFQLRGEESSQDEQFVSEMAKEFGVPFHTMKFDTSDHSDENHISIQMAARELRYSWFEQLLRDNDYQYIATAHHHNDSVETALFNFTKGTGISGMRGILPKQNQVIRPLLFSTKKEIAAYATKHHLKWREDSSNASDKYHRNLIRNNILPKLAEINPSYEQTSKHTLERLRDTESIVEHYANETKSTLYHQKGQDHYFKIEELKQLIGINSVLYFWLKSFGFNYVQVKSIASQLDQVGKVFPTSSHRANIDRSYLIISPIADQKQEIFILEEGTTSLELPIGKLGIEQAGVPKNIPHDSCTAWLDSKKLSFPLTVRKWQEGDKFRPLGMSGFKKISDFLIDTKTPINLKERVYVLLSDNEIAWVIGYRIDDRYKVNDDTENVLQVSLSIV